MPPNPEATRQQLITAAEQLFAARGIDGVSLREVNLTAGQRNSTALQYHFEDRAGLLRAVLAKHHPDVEARRHALLDDYESGPPGDVRALAGALVRPLAAKLADRDGGRDYLRILAEVTNRFDQRPANGRKPRDDSLDRWRVLVGPLLPEVAVGRLHRRFTAIRIAAVELARRAERPPSADDRLFTANIVDLVTAILETPISAETDRLLNARRPRRQ